MKKYLSILILLLFTYSAHSSVLDPLSRIELQKNDKVKSRDDSGIKYRSIIIECESPAAFDELCDKGAIIFHTRGNMALACVPAHLISEFESWPSLMRASLSRTRSLTLDIARQATNVNTLHSGRELTREFKGKGVVAGLSDVGFDAGHIAFRTRVKGLSHYNDTTATAIKIDSAEDMESWLTDNSHETHATHVAGIMTGGDYSSPYYGVAPEADIYATTSILHDVGILAGIEDIISYAKEKGLPAVINLSLGSKIGPHDGTDLMCRYLDMCAESDAAILMAAGNDGDMNVSVSKTFTDDDHMLSTRLRSVYWDDVTVYNAFIDAWSSDFRPLKLRFRTWDKTLEKYTFATEWIEFSDDAVWQISEKTDSEFAQLYDGSIMAAGELNPYNNRYNISIAVSLHSKVYLPEHHWSNHSMIIEFSGEDGAVVDACIEGMCEFTYMPAGEPVAPSPDLSVSSIACGRNITCVGSATTRDLTPYYGGGQIKWSGITPGTMSGFSSYGALADGRKLPHFSAPGAMIISSLSRHYLSENPDFANRLAAESPDASGHYYYAECGTSMATPHAAGVFALWLEADPTLTGTELREIAINTASQSAVDMGNPRCGAGMIDALAGLRHILSTQGTAAPETVESLIEVYRDGERLCVKGAEDASIEVFDITGCKVSPDALPTGPVIVKIVQRDGVITTKKLL